MKKVLFLLLMVAAFVACSKDDDEDNDESKLIVATPETLIGEWMSISDSYSYYLKFFADTTGLYMKLKSTTTVMEKFNFKYKIKGFGITYTTNDFEPVIDSCGIAFRGKDLVFGGNTYFKYEK